MVELETTMALTTHARKACPKRKNFDWISEPRPHILTPFQQFTIDVDWEKSPLGPMAQWPAQLRQMVLLIFQDPSPAVVYWGDDATIIYNEPYTQLIGQKHPSLQGQDPKIGFAEVWDYFETLLAKQRETGETSTESNALLFLHRHGFLEETYFSWKFVPIIGCEGWVVGSHATVVEVTREVISDRRISTVRSLSHHLALSKSIQELWKKGIVGLGSAEIDIPLALLFSVSSSGRFVKSPEDSVPANGMLSTICTLEASIGIPANHKLSPAEVDLQTDQYFLIPSFLEVMKGMNTVELTVDKSMEADFEGITWRGFGIPSTKFIVCPIVPADSHRILAFLVVALNPRRPYDEDYRSFLHLCTQQVTLPQLSAVILREEVEKQQQMAAEEALDRDRLSKQLSESETKFARFATRAPIGLAILEPNGLALSANPLWKELTSLEVGANKVLWDQVLADGEYPLVTRVWDKLLTEKKSQHIQTRMKKPWQAPDLDSDGNIQWQETHILLVIYPDFDKDGNLDTIMSCVQDISGLKWSESQLRRRMDQAIEMKRQQEKFIDMTSHEMRNPLSALIGCADEIITSLSEFRNAVKIHSFSVSSQTPCKETPIPMQLIEEAIEAADIIIYCAMHQKRIIDDILTLSRLDSNLLHVSPEPSQPIQLIHNSLKMFDAELRRADIKLNFIEDESLKALGIQWTLLDPSRVLQVLINLLTNAIKFTRTEKSRHITVTVAASLEAPSKANSMGIQYVGKSHASTDQTMKSEWGNGELIYLTITVTDTGRGLSDSETEKLFHLFTQANPKTYQTYGGSGLGLFISRQLVEMQGGEVGVRSEAGKGSIFQFYVKTRKTVAAVQPQVVDFQLLVRQDAIKEACAVDFEGMQTATSVPKALPEKSRPTSRSSIQSSSPHHLPLIHSKVKYYFHILVVEDNLVNQKVVTKQLRKSGHVVHVANHGEEALDFLRSSNYWVTGPDSTVREKDKERLDVILMDLEMPVMDGLTCVKRIRELQNNGEIRGHVPVIAVTANARKDQIEACLDAGMDDVTTKPYRMQVMIKQIETLVSKRNETTGDSNQ